MEVSRNAYKINFQSVYISVYNIHSIQWCVTQCGL